MEVWDRAPRLVPFLLLCFALLLCWLCVPFAFVLFFVVELVTYLFWLQYLSGFYSFHSDFEKHFS